MACHGGRHGSRLPRALGLAALVCVAGCSGRELEHGDKLLSEGRYTEAIAVWKQALASNPRDLKPLIRIATAQARQVADALVM